MPASEVRGVELAWTEHQGGGAPVLLVHETAVDSAAWSPVAEALAAGGARAIAYDRRGWGDSTAPDGYARTTVEEQSEDSAALIGATGAAPAVVAGAGLGAVIALDLALRLPDLVAGLVLIEPPALSLLPEATEMLSADRRAIESAAGEGRDALVRLYLSGGLGALAAGADRLPAELTEPARERPVSLVAEIGCAQGWGMQVSRLGTVAAPALVAVSAGTPSVLRAASEQLVVRLHAGELREVEGELPPHIGAPGEIADACTEVAGEAGSN